VRSEYFNSGLSKYILTITIQSQRKNEVKDPVKRPVGFDNFSWINKTLRTKPALCVSYPVWLGQR
jgi:hypothetical protein